MNKIKERYIILKCKDKDVKISLKNEFTLLSISYVSKTLIIIMFNYILEIKLTSKN